MSIRIAVKCRQGQIARALSEAGPALNVEVINLGLPQLDLAAPETVGPALKEAAPDVVVNAAAYTAVDQAERESENAFEVNSAGAGAVAEAARALGVPVVQLSTDYVFDGNKTSAYLEGDLVAPAGVYGDSKLADIATADYPTSARRPANSRLDCGKLARVHGIELPAWRDSLGICLERLKS